MSLSSRQSMKTGFAANGRILCFAAPLMTGFRGSPLALSSGKVALKPKNCARRNYAKRRAYGE